MANFAEYFQRLLGVWKLNRKISDGSTLVGAAHFNELDSQYQLTESGILTLADGSSMEAKRDWIWQLIGPDQLEIFYDENPLRLYHSVKLMYGQGSWSGSAMHLCEPDTYDGNYRFTNGEFHINQTVSGPKKDYSITSIYSS